MKEKGCKLCGKLFKVQLRKNTFCSMKCYLTSRWGQGKCKYCEKECEHTYCSEDCRTKYWHKNSYRVHKKKWYWTRKLALMDELGGKCIECGESDYIVLDIDHIDRNKKDMFKNHQYTNTRRLREWTANKSNLQLLCANCHRRKTHKQMKYAMFEFKKQSMWQSATKD